MKLLKTILFSVIPFTVFGFYHGFAKPFYQTDREMMLIMSIISVILICAIIVIQKMMNDGNYFPVTVLAAFIFLTGLIFFIPENQYTMTVSSGGITGSALGRPLYVLFAAMFLMSVLPPVFRRPFTFYFSKKKVPEALWSTELFYRINLYINYIWAFLFAGCFAAQMLPGTFYQFGIPLFLKLGIGLPVTKLLPGYLQKKLILK